MEEAARLHCVCWPLCVGNADGEAAGVQGCEGRAKTMTGTVALALCVGYLAWVFVAQAAATAHLYTCR
jgi:hypothetical protein